MRRYLTEKMKFILGRCYSTVYKISGNKEIYIVSSYGRSASTLVWHSISDALLPGYILGNRLASAIEKGLWCESALSYKNNVGFVFKTHRRPDVIKYDFPEKYIRNIYVISMPSESIKSILMTTKELGIGWFRRHMGNLGAEHIKYPMELVESDALKLRERIYDWSSSEHSITLKYESLWDDLDKLSAFVGRKVCLPPKRKRQEKQLTDHEESLLKLTYSDIDDIYNKVEF